MKFKRLRLNWYKILYSTGDKELIEMFWRFFKNHRISKNRSARCVMLSYYSGSKHPVPGQVLHCFNFNRERQIALTPIPWNDPDKLDELL